MDGTVEQPRTDGKGIKCPQCQCPRLLVIRTTRMVGKIRRTRRCGECKHEPIYTFEATVGEAR